jgi:hypothetical protein
MNRREKRFLIKKQEKELLALDREMEELRKKSNEPIEYMEVKPIRDGWIRYFDLREDLKGRSDYKYLREILDVCNVEQFCRNKKFKIPKKNWRYYNLDKDFHLKNLSDKERNKLSERAKTEFWKEEKVSWSGGIYNIWHPAIPSWMLVAKIKPHYIRYFGVFDNEAKSQYQRLRNKFETNNLYPKLNKLYGWGNGYDDWDYSYSKKRMIEVQAKKEMKEESGNYF